jgi:uncharacterized protein (DUF486 family)
METASTLQLQFLLDIYDKILPSITFPYIPFIIAAIFQSLAWVSGPIILKDFTLGPRMIILILFAIGEYLFMSPAMNAGVELLKMTESKLVITYHIITLLVFIIINIYIFNKSFETKYIYAVIFCILAIYFAHK